MDQQNVAIAVGGIIVSLGILAVGFNKLTPYNFQPEYSDDLQNTYPVSNEDDELFDQPRRSENTSVIVGGRTLCKRCSTRNTRKK